VTNVFASQDLISEGIAYGDTLVAGGPDEARASLRPGQVNVSSAQIDPTALFLGYKQSGDGRERANFACA